MHNADSLTTARALLAPEIVCEPAPEFDRTTLESVRHAFQIVEPISFRQSWRAEEEAAFCPATVRVRWRERSLLVFAELRDADAFNNATKPNQRTWELCDTFEMFLRPEGGAGYTELHVTPNNQRLQLHYPRGIAPELALQAGRFEEFLLPEDSFDSATWVDAKNSRWSVYAEIPALTICEAEAPLENSQWRFSFCRYDYTRGVRDPVISSTSPHAQPDFHRQHDWGRLTFKARA